MYIVLVPGLLVTCVLLKVGQLVKDVVPEIDWSVKCAGVVPA